MKKLYKLADTIFEIDHLFDSSIENMKEYEVNNENPKYFISYTKRDLEMFKKERIDLLKGFEIDEINDCYIYRKVGMLLPLENKFIFHGSAIYLDSLDNGYIFTASSGTGKSTHSRLLKECYGDRIQYINDDKPFIFNQNGSFLIYGGPWNGKEKISNNVKCVLKGIFVIERGNKNTATRISPALALNHLTKQFFIPEGKIEASNALKCLIDLCSNVPVYILNVDMSNNAAKSSYEIMNLNKKETH